MRLEKDKHRKEFLPVSWNNKSTPKYLLRPAKIGDADAVMECVHEAFSCYVERMGLKPGPMLMDYAHEISENQVSVVEIQGQIIGVLVMKIKIEGFLLDVIAVDPHFQGVGVGKLMLEFAESEAQQQGYTSIYLYTHEKMTENLALYAKIGYVEYDRRLEMGLARVYMRKILP